MNGKLNFSTTPTPLKIHSGSPHFRAEALRFLRGLKRNNDREWFEARRAVYERELKQPMLAILEAITQAMIDFAPGHVRPAQKSLMRIYRDTRFSADKSPYKTQVAAWWTHNALSKTSGAGYYFHLSSTEFTIAAGVYMPPPEQLLAIRKHLLTHHEELRKLLDGKKLRRVMELHEPMALTRPPKGFPAAHPALDLIRWRQWGVTATLPAEAALEPDMLGAIVSRFRLAAPLVDFLNGPLLSSSTPAKRVLFPLP